MFPSPIKSGTGLRMSFTFAAIPTLFNKIYYEIRSNAKVPLGTCTVENRAIICTDITIAIGTYNLYFNKDTVEVGIIPKQLIVKEQNALSVSPTEVIVDTDSLIEITMEFEVRESEGAMLSYQLGNTPSISFKSCNRGDKVVACSVNIGTLGIYKILYNTIITTLTFEVKCE